MKKTFLLFILAFGMTYLGWGQISITSMGTPVTQNFDAMLGTSATAALTTNQWRAASNIVAATWTAANLTATTQLGGTLAAVSTGGCYNYGDGAAATATDRALGFLSSGTTPWPGTSTTPLNIYAQFINSTGSIITQLSGSFDIEKYRNGTNAAGWSINFFYSLDGTNWTAVSSGNQSFAADANNSAVNPAGSYPKTFTITGLTITNSSNFYLRWAYFVTTGTTATNAQGLGIDNLSISASGAVTAPTTQAHDITFSSISTSGMTATWTNGNGTKRIVIMNIANSFTDPVDGTDPSASTVYGGSGEQVVYNNNGNSVSVTSLSASTTYWFRVYEYNGSGSGTKYLTTTATNNPNSQATNSAAVAPSISSPTATSITANSAALGGNITSDGGSGITERGTVWKTSTGVTITDNKLAEGGTSTGVFSHSRTSFPAKTLIYYKAYATNIVGTTLTTESSFYTLADEPTSHVTGFAAAAGSTTTIDLSWSGAATGANGYIILQRLGASAPTGTPTDATGYSVGNTIGDGTVAALVSPGSTLSKTISSLSPSTQYSFTIIPYAWDGANALTYNYYTAATIPYASATTNTPLPITYYWDGGASTTNWSDAANWNPDGTPGQIDNVVLDNSIVTGTYSVNIGSTSVSINRLTLSPGPGNIITLTLTSSNTGIPGLKVGDNTSGTDDIIINNGGILVNSSTASSGNGIELYSNTATNTGTIVINNGGRYLHNTLKSSSGVLGTGTGVQCLSSVAGTETGIFEYDHPGTASQNPSASGRTYGSLTLTRSAGAATYSTSGGSALTIRGNFLINTGVTYTTSMTGAMNVAGNFTNNGASLSLASTQAVNFNGSNLQTISGSGSISILGGVTMSNNAGIVADRDISFGGNLNITTGSLTINAGKNLTVAGTTTTNGNLTLKSPAGTGPTGSFLPTGAVSGNVTVERYIPQYTSNADGWYFLSSPVSGQLISPNFAPGTYDDVYRWNEIVTDYPWINYKGPSPFSTFNSGEGYLVAYQASATKSFTGSLNQSDITLTDQSFTVASTWSGWHLLGNPYSCAVKWNDGNWGAMTNVEAIAQIWNSGGTYTTRDATDPIPAMNGFMVHVTSGTNSMTIPLAARTHSGIDWMKSIANIQDKLMLTAASTENTTYVETIVQFNEEATPAFDMAYDGHFLSGIAAAPQLYSIVGNEHLCVNTLPQTANTRTVHLGFVKGSSVNYTMNVTGLESFNPGVSVFLEDTKVSKTQDLRQSSAYSFNAADGDNTNRFLLHFGGLFGVNELNKENAIQIYAYNNTIYVANNGGQQVTGHVFVYNLMGQLLMQQELGDNKLTKFNLSGSTGYYLVKVITSENSYSAKLFLR